MKHDSIAPQKRKAVNVLLDTGVVAAARAQGINLSRVAEEALRIAVKREQERRWREDHREWIADFTQWYDREGDPLAHLETL